MAVDADVVIVGAGPAGAAAGLFAARRGRRVVMIDEQRFPRDKPCGEGLMPSGRSPLRDLGLDEMVASSAPPLVGAQLGLQGRQFATARFPQHGPDQAGVGVRRFDFDNTLVEAVRREPNIRLMENTRAAGFQRGSAGVAIETSSGEIRARCAVAADGLRSSIRHRLGWTKGPRTPHRYGVVGHWAIDGPVDPWIRITFAEGLEIYEGPVANNQRMVGVLGYRQPMRIFAGDLRGRYREVVRAIRPEFDAAEQVGPVHARGPFWYRASTVAERGIFLVGDAAGFTDPITGEGIASGLREARAFAAALDAPDPERAYRLAHRQITTNPRRIAALFLRLTRTPALVERGVKNNEVAPQILSKLLGVGFGYWGFNRVTPREWVRIFTGR